MDTVGAGDRSFRNIAKSRVPYVAVSPKAPLRAEQFAHRLDVQPEQRLMIALMRDSIRCIEKYRRARDTVGKRHFAEESRWVLSNDRDWLYAFVRICEVLDLEPDAVRCSLRVTNECDESRPLRATSSRVMDLRERSLSC
jgi:hypothetical protein